MEAIRETDIAPSVSDRQTAAIAATLERSKEFAKALKTADDYLKSTQKTEEELKNEAEAAQERKETEKKICELRALIAHLRQKLASSGYRSDAVAAQLSAAETELYWLLLNL